MKSGRSSYVSVLFIFVAVALAFLLGVPNIWPKQERQRYGYNATITPDSNLIFRERGFRFEVPPSEVGSVFLLQSGESIVELSIDRTVFGSPDPPGTPRITCRDKMVCTDVCAAVNGVPPGCPDIRNGWYRLLVIPSGQSWGVDPSELNRGPREGAGVRCADASLPGLQFCWDPRRITPTEPISNAREVEYAALKHAAAATWVSKELGPDAYPTFVASCAATACFRDIWVNGARVQVTFHSEEMSDWRRFDAGLRSFLGHLIQPVGH